MNQDRGAHRTGRRGPAGRAARAMRSALPALPLLLLAGCRFGAPPGGTEQGQRILDLYRLFVYFAIGVGGVTYALILWAVLRYRRRADRLPPQTRYHAPIEVAYTLVPVVIVLVLFGFTFRTSGEVTRLAEDPDVVIQVEGFQWQWSFWYPDLDVRIVGTPERPPTMVVPVGETVRLVLTGNDVIHAFYVPGFLFKRDTIPGVRTQVDFVMPRPGTYRGVCAEYCGLNHDDMEFFVRGVPEAEFRTWVDRQRGEAP